MSLSLPSDVISVIAGLAFLVFGVWSLRGDELTEEEAAKARRTTRSAFLAVGAGAVLGRQLPQKVVRIGAAVLFFVFGALLIGRGIVG